MPPDTNRIAAAQAQMGAMQAEIARLQAEIAALETVETAEQDLLDRVLSKFDRLRKAIDKARAGGDGSPPGLPPRNGAPPVTADENDRLKAMPADELAGMDLTVGDTKELFSEDYMLRLAREPIKGEGNPDLKGLMREVGKSEIHDPRLTEVMTALSGIVGSPPTADTLKVHYARFLIVRKQQETRGAPKKAVVDPLDEGMHPEFMGSRSQLVFGKVLGDAFGIHEVFAALLSPTGGLVGPGNWLIEGKVKAGHLDPDNPVALHGTVHDAAGYLGTFHGEGPGYNYRDSQFEVVLKQAIEQFTEVDDCLSGQLSGIAFWVGEVGQDYVEREMNDALADLDKKLQPVRDAAQAEIDKRVAAAKRDLLDKVAAAEKLAREAEKAVTGIGDAIKDAGKTVENSAVETVENAGKALGEVVPEARRKLEAAWNLIWS